MGFLGERHPFFSPPHPGTLPRGERKRGEGGFGLLGVTGLVWDLIFVMADTFYEFPITNVGNDGGMNGGNDGLMNGGKDGLVEGRGGWDLMGIAYYFGYRHLLFLLLSFREEGTVGDENCDVEREFD